MRSCGHGAWSAGRSSVDRRQIASWTAARGWRLAHICEERASDRPADRRLLLREALERVESGESDGIVIARLDQFGSSLGEVLNALERIQAAGGTFASVGDGIDLSTTGGHRTLRVLASVSDWWLP